MYDCLSAYLGKSSESVKAWAVDCGVRLIRDNQRFSTWRWLRAILIPRSEKIPAAFKWCCRRWGWACDQIDELLLIPITLNLLLTWIIELILDMAIQRKVPLLSGRDLWLVLQRRPNVFDVDSTLYNCYTNIMQSGSWNVTNSNQPIVDLHNWVGLKYDRTMESPTF